MHDSSFVAVAEGFGSERSPLLVPGSCQRLRREFWLLSENFPWLAAGHASIVPSKPLLRLKGSRSTSGADCCDATRGGGGGGLSGARGARGTHTVSSLERLMSPITNPERQKLHFFVSYLHPESNQMLRSAGANEKHLCHTIKAGGPERAQMCLDHIFLSCFESESCSALLCGGTKRRWSGQSGAAAGGKSGSDVETRRNKRTPWQRNPL